MKSRSMNIVRNHHFHQCYFSNLSAVGTHCEIFYGTTAYMAPTKQYLKLKNVK